MTKTKATISIEKDLKKRAFEAFNDNGQSFSAVISLLLDRYLNEVEDGRKTNN